MMATPLTLAPERITFAPMRMAIWLFESPNATAALRTVSCDCVTVHAYTTTPPIGTRTGLTAVMVCAAHGCGLDYEGRGAEPSELFPTVAEAFAAHGYLTVGGPP